MTRRVCPATHSPLPVSITTDSGPNRSRAGSKSCSCSLLVIDGDGEEGVGWTLSDVDRECGTSGREDMRSASTRMEERCRDTPRVSVQLPVVWV